MPSPSSSGSDKLDIRIALVLYGGVSLAIYENGVTRCFYDLVQKRGIFSVLLDLLDATAQVDTIAGTSAGGINGLLLAATLESGADFAESAALWRRLGDLGDLMRDSGQADEAQSLLKGETYYQDELIKAFRTYCKTPDGGLSEYHGEIDVFITGTDLDGQERRNWDALGTLIYDKEHRVVFQLQHRPFRKALGYFDRGKDAVAADEQGTILGTIARITSSFPAAFPPFRLEHLEPAHGQYRAAVQLALGRSAKSTITELDRRSFADGGLLDNKPFGPVLEAIFHRMPTDVTERWLFYVEPDPEPRPKPPDPQHHTPLNVAADSLAAIPSHESIWGDLQTLQHHNAQVRWLKSLNRRWLEVLANPAEAGFVDQTLEHARGAVWAPYWQTRVESLARSFFLASDASTPFAHDSIDSPRHRALAEVVAAGLRQWTEPASEASDGETPVGRPPLLDSFDVDFQLRRSFRVLYEIFGTLQRYAAPGTRTYADCRTAMRLVGRIIKTQKLIRDCMLGLRQNALAQIDARAPLAEMQIEAAAPAAEISTTELAQNALQITNLFRLFLRAGAPHWNFLGPHLKRDTDELRSLADDWQSFFRSEDLSAVAHDARVASDPATLVRQFDPEWTVQRLATEDLSMRRTVLDDIEDVLRRVLDEFCRKTEGLAALADGVDRFARIDPVLYPLEFVGAVYELDEIDYVRISPQDAQVGLSAGPARDKIAGDELFHFSAFLRKDFRSNDILQGRLDGICQIVRTLLAPTSRCMRRVQRNSGALGQLFVDSKREELKLQCSSESWTKLAAAWEELALHLKKADLPEDDAEVVAYSPLRAAWDVFCSQLTTVGQEDAFQDAFPMVLEDHFYQEMAFGNAGGPDCTTAASSRTMLEGGAARAAHDQLMATRPADRWGLFLNMRIGSQPLDGRDSAVPPHIVGEYVTQIYLLFWGMVRRSVGSVGRAVMDQQSVRIALRHPIAFLNLVFFLMRRSDNLALGTIVSAAGVLIGIAGAAFYLGGHTGFGVGAVVVLLLFMAVVVWALPVVKRWPFAVAFTPLLIAVAFGVVGWFAVRLLPSLNQETAQRVFTFFLDRAALTGILIGAAGATVVWLAVMWRRGRRR